MLTYLLFIIPPLILALIAQGLVKCRYAIANRKPASMSGAAAARKILDSAGLQSVEIEMIQGKLTDHYDPRAKVLRLSQEVYQGRTLSAVGIAAHEAGHAIQDARHYLPLVLNQMAYPAVAFGSNATFLLIFAGCLLNMAGLILAGVILFGVTTLYQIVNLPVEYNASSRAKAQLAQLGIVSGQDMVWVRRVLGAAALTYVAAMISSLMQLMYYLLIFFGNRDDG